MQIKKEQEIIFRNQKVVTLRLINDLKQELLLSNYGASILSVIIPIENNRNLDIALGYRNIEELLRFHNYPEKFYFGSTVGRYANRIAQGKFNINGSTYQLSRNESINHLHGGFFGLNKAVWDYRIDYNKNQVQFFYTSKDGDEGYPGNLEIKLIVSFNNLGEIKLEYEANTDKTTPVNLTNHTYFNLNGGCCNVLNHSVRVNSDFIMETDQSNIPTGKLLPVKTTDFDLNVARKLEDIVLMKQKGFDNSYVLGAKNTFPCFAGEISEKSNPVSVKFYTTEPSIQLYTANALDGSFIGKENRAYQKYYGICIEAQSFPDAPNHNNFPNTILTPTEIYKQVTIYKICTNYE
ncbi:MAG: galactose mutarotase [Bacteroidales bacterium]|nr:galactose mutarotase [Bacteroidales bacterium]